MVPIISIYTTAGVRPDNEDTVYPLPGAVQSDVFIVADGLGGHQDGKAASQLACDTIANILTTQDPTYYTINAQGKSEVEVYKDFITGAIRQAAAMVKQRADQAGSDMSTTALVVMIHSQTVYLAQVGDCALFHCMKGQVPEKLTREQRIGKRLTQVLGPQDGMRVSPQVLSFPFDPYSALVMGSDGFWESLDAARTGQILNTCPPHKAAEAIGRAALDANSLDNVSVIVVLGEEFGAEKPIEKPTSQENIEPVEVETGTGILELVIVETDITFERASSEELVGQEVETAQENYRREIDDLMQKNEEFLAQNERLNKELSDREKGKYLQESELAKRSQELSIRETEASSREQKLSFRESQLSDKEQRLSLRETELSNREQEISLKDTVLTNRAQGISLRDSELSIREQELSLRETELSNREQELSTRGTDLQNREQALSDKQKEFSEREKDLQEIQFRKKEIELEHSFTKSITSAIFTIHRKYPKIVEDVLTIGYIQKIKAFAEEHKIYPPQKPAGGSTTETGQS